MSFKKTFLILTIFLLSLLIGCSANFKLPKSEINVASPVYDIKGRLIYTITRQNRISVPIEQIPANLQNAIVAIEDKKFYSHHGFNFTGIARATLRNIEARKIVEGGSTITQQLAKNLYLSQERTFSRKIKEIYLTIALERKYTKKEILAAYLNQIYFGQGAYGIEIAAETYFGKSTKDLSLAESAMLAGIPGLPNKFNPYADFTAAKERQALVLDQMAKLKMISPAEAARAKNEPLKLKSGQIPTGKAPYFIQEIVKYITNKYDNGAALLYNQGLSIYTTLDLNMQDAAENAFTAGLKYTDPDLQGALVAIEPKTGYVKAYVGGRNYNASKFDRVLTHRQPGSAFKPFVYAAAIDKGLTAAQTFTCEPVEYPQTDGTIYKPTDFNQGYHYRTFTLKEALTISDNVVSVELNNRIGPQVGADYARKLGIKSSLRPYLSLVLGTSEVTPLEMANAYGTFANQGVKTEPILITKIINSNGNTLEENKTKATKVLDAKVAYIITDMLENVVGPDGTASKVSSITSRPVAGKTGTSQNYSDAWFVGYTPDLVASVYLGFDQPSRSVGETGGGLAAPIWANFINMALKDATPKPFPIPNGIIQQKICPDSGLLAPEGTDFIEIPFIAGTEPIEYCPMHDFNIPSNSNKNKHSNKNKIKVFFDWLFK